MPEDSTTLRHRLIPVDETVFHVVDAGDAQAPPVLFLHGWPESWRAWRPVMSLASRQARVLAIDLPGVGQSTGAATDGSKRRLASLIGRLAEALELSALTLAGHDIGGMIAYACLRELDDLARVVIMDTAVPGVDPWDEVLHNPYIWHFALHAIPELPEHLVQGRQRTYFDYFYNVLSADPAKITNRAREDHARAYTTDSALTASFNWYRTLTQDATDNRRTAGQPVSTPVLYLRGERESGAISTYLTGFQEAGLANLHHNLVPQAGHFPPEEAPAQTWRLIADFAGF